MNEIANKFHFFLQIFGQAYFYPECTIWQYDGVNFLSKFLSEV